MGCRSFPLRLIAPFSASITQPDRYAHHPAITATRSRNAISRFRLLGFLRTRSESSRRWLALLSCKTILLHCALLPHESFFRPALKRRGYQTPEFFPCSFPTANHFCWNSCSIAIASGLQLLESRPLQRQGVKALTAGLTEARQGFSELPNVAVESEQIRLGISEPNLARSRIYPRPIALRRSRRPRFR